MKILIAASECSPFIKIGGIADVIEGLPKALLKNGVETRVVIPFYKPLLESPESKGFVKEYENYFQYDNLNLKYEVHSTSINNLKIYFILNFDYITNGGVYYDKILENIPNAEALRFSLFSKIIALHFTSRSDYIPDIIHCNDWHTSAITQFLEELKRTNPLIKTKTLLTIHNLAYQGFTTRDVVRKIGLSEKEDKTVYWDLLDDNLDLLLQGITGADIITTVSETYAKEIQTKEFGEGLQDILKARNGSIYGILNGIDIDRYNPATDVNLFQTYDSNSVFNSKLSNKSDLIGLLKLDNNLNAPIICLISRLVDQKGLDILIPILDKIIELGASIVILGKGDPSIENTLMTLESNPTFKNRLRCVIEFSNNLAMKLYGSSDFILVPSKFEPCGLTQIIAMKYGTIPIVRMTGGLADSVADNETGYVFKDYTSEKLYLRIRDAITTYYKKNDTYKNMVLNAMSVDLSWDTSSLKYISLYNKLLALERF